MYVYVKIIKKQVKKKKKYMEILTKALAHNHSFLSSTCYIVAQINLYWMSLTSNVLVASVTSNKL